MYSLQTPISAQSRAAVETIADGLAESVVLMEKTFGTKLDPARLEEACILSNEAAEYAKKCAHLRFTSPPLVRGSEAIYNAVVFSQLWGTQDLVDIQKAYFEELLQKKEWAESRYSIDDTHRLLWLHLPPFYDTKHLTFIETTCNAPIVFEETNYVGWDPLDPKDPYRSLARRLLQSGFLDPAQRVEYVRRAIPAGKFNGVILYTHGFGRCSLADRAFSKLLRETLDKAGCPLLSLEGDCMDASIDPCSTVTKIASFVEALNLNRYGNIFGRVKDA
jgi:benzoyl-CoA reductase/2-hydroxyglutaryl-CoA dehydratase subunit BcrC/BadD/HgdB